ncbi:uncharacterized protein [Aegilops tauschii subsp. strangulata]|uniref:uncharacterized protein n=1 Tax=Aegilops tauschii subsp. strangulata TaxID=200361 RepID=UPI000989D1C5
MGARPDRPLTQPAAALVAAHKGCLLTGSGRSGIPKEKTHTVPAPSIYLSQRHPSGRDVAVADLATAPLTCVTRSGASPLEGGEEGGAGGEESGYGRETEEGGCARAFEGSRFWIDLFDFLEENRVLSADEAALQRDARLALAASIRRQCAHWRQRGKRRAVCEGDENTRFFHASASQRRRRNSISTLEVEGVQVVDHAGKAVALLAYYSALLGRPRTAVWRFDLAGLYAQAPRGAKLVAQFDLAEIKTAADKLDRSSAPGPDGLGPAFYQAAWGEGGWPMISNGSSTSSTPAQLGLTSRLQQQIPLLIDEDQSGFVRGRSISENFVYATELVQCCHRRAASAVVLKLDFAKAFDSICWESLRAIMEVRGFPSKWCDWIDALFHSSRSAVLLDGVPGRWFQVKCGLRQGDPVSPYLFLIVADVHQQLIRQDDVMRHPLLPEAPAVVLQYADDTQIIMRACADGAARLRRILDQFADATGLVINFSKSTLVDMYLAGWAAHLLSPAGRLVLINAVLDALPTYAMAALLLPPSVVHALDALRRSFLWNVAERATGAQCLVAWERVCRAKSEGGIGVRDLATQNTCLLLKMLHRLHAMPRSRWAAWIWSSAGGRSILNSGELARGEHRASDSWLPCGPVAVAYPALFSHATDAEATVWQVRRRGLTGCLVPRLTRAGERELHAVSALLVAATPPGEGEDTRQLRHAAAPRNALSSSAAYRLLRFGGARASFADIIWGARIPSRVQFFSWLLVQRRIHTRDVLLRKCIVAATEADCPLCAAPLETADHMLFAYPFAGAFWNKLGVDTDGVRVCGLPRLATAVGAVTESAVEFALLCCWQLWKHRNAVVFQRQQPSLQRVVGCCREDTTLWRGRLPESRRGHVETWLHALSV